MPQFQHDEEDDKRIRGVDEVIRQPEWSWIKCGEGIVQTIGQHQQRARAQPVGMIPKRAHRRKIKYASKGVDVGTSNYNSVIIHKRSADRDSVDGRDQRGNQYQARYKISSFDFTGHGSAVPCRLEAVV